MADETDDRLVVLWAAWLAEIDSESAPAMVVLDAALALHAARPVGLGHRCCRSWCPGDRAVGCAATAFQRPALPQRGGTASTRRPGR
jgi:hypothetical protein